MLAHWASPLRSTLYYIIASSWRRTDFKLAYAFSSFNQGVFTRSHILKEIDYLLLRLRFCRTSPAGTAACILLVKSVRAWMVIVEGAAEAVVSFGLKAWS